MNSFLQVGFLHYGNSHGLYLNLCKCSVVHYLLIQRGQHPLSWEFFSPWSKTLRVQVSESPTSEAQDFKQGSYSLWFLYQPSTLGPAVSLLTCKWVTEQGSFPCTLQDRNSMRNTLPPATTKNGSFSYRKHFLSDLRMVKPRPGSLDPCPYSLWRVICF